MWQGSHVSQCLPCSYIKQSWVRTYSSHEKDCMREESQTHHPAPLNYCTWSCFFPAEITSGGTRQVRWRSEFCSPTDILRQRRFFNFICKRSRCVHGCSALSSLTLSTAAFSRTFINTTKWTVKTGDCEMCNHRLKHGTLYTKSSFLYSTGTVEIKRGSFTS